MGIFVEALARVWDHDRQFRDPGQPAMRQIVLDTETTGLEPAQGHRIIEIGCVELVDRRLTGNNFHIYLQPDREIDAAAVEVHGITNEFLADKPRFEDSAADLLSYLQGAELVIHNAPFDVGFLDAEFARIEGMGATTDYCGVLDTLLMARKKHPGQRNSLDALCGRYDVDNSRRDKHGALLDAEILADVYLAMTGGQRALSLDAEIRSDNAEGGRDGIRRVDREGLQLVVIAATAEELAAHEERLAAIDRASGGEAVWRRLQ
jgi:DNA polymerase-3 subunit epsilon